MSVVAASTMATPKAAPSTTGGFVRGSWPESTLGHVAELLTSKTRNNLPETPKNQHLAGQWGETDVSRAGISAANFVNPLPRPQMELQSRKAVV